MHRRKQPAHKIIFVHSLVAMHGAVITNQPVEILIIQRPHHHMHPVPMHGMHKRGKLPAAKMRGEKQNSLASRISLLIILQPVIHNNLVNIFQRVFRKVADLRELSPQRSKFPAQNPRPLRLSFFRKRHGQIAHPHMPQSHVQKINAPSQRNTDGPGHGPWQNTKDFDERPGCRVLKSLPHSGEA